MTEEHFQKEHQTNVRCKKCGEKLYMHNYFGLYCKSCGNLQRYLQSWKV